MLISTEEEDRMVIIRDDSRGREVFFIGRIREYDEAGMFLKNKQGQQVKIVDRKYLREPGVMDRLLYL